MPKTRLEFKKKKFPVKSNTNERTQLFYRSWKNLAAEKQGGNSRWVLLFVCMGWLIFFVCMDRKAIYSSTSNGIVCKNYHLSPILHPMLFIFTPYKTVYNIGWGRVNSLWRKGFCCNNWNKMREKTSFSRKFVYNLLLNFVANGAIWRTCKVSQLATRVRKTVSVLRAHVRYQCA